MAKKAAPKAAETKPAAPAPAPAAAKKKSDPAPKVKPATKGQIYAELATATGLSKKDVASVFDALGEVVKNHLGKKGSGLFLLPGLLKLKVVRKPATKAKMGVNPFTKEPMEIKAKPARNAVKAIPLKSLKEMV